MAFRITSLMAFLLVIIACKIPVNPAFKISGNDPVEGSLPLEKIKLPPGFQIDIYAENVTNARSLCLSPSGTLFVSTRKFGSVYAVIDSNNDYKADKVITLISGLELPNGVAFKDGDLYVMTLNELLKFENIESQLDSPPKPIVIFDKYPTKKHHGWKYIAFGPDEKLYIPVGAPCNVCDSENEIFSSITRMNPDGSEFEIVQHGIRNTVGFDWHPETGELWFTDNGRDWMGDDMPFCELNRATEFGQHFGFPYCHQGDLIDNEYGDGKSCEDYIPPVQNLGPHVAPLGMEFYTGNQFPKKYVNQVLIAEHGSWNRTNPIGYQVSLVRIDENGNSLGYDAFATGWLQGETAWGRPVDLELLPDGSMLVSDDYANAIYRISYIGG